MCDCTDGHAITCYGCGICYHKSLNEHNAVLKSNGVKSLFPDYDTGDNLVCTDYGSLRWFCPVCDAALKKGFVQSLDKKEATALNNEIPTMENDLLAKLNAETVEMRATLNRVAAHLDSRADSFMSPKRKSARVSWKDDDIEPTLSMFPHNDSNEAHQAVPPRNSKPSTYSDLVKLNIKTSNNVLKKLHEQRHLVSRMSTRKVKSDGSIDVLFKSFNEAEKAKCILDEKLGNAAVSHPSLDGLKRYHLVGLTFEMSKLEVQESIVDENRWLNLKKSSDDSIMINDDPFSILHVHDVVKCKNNDIFRVTVSLSRHFLASLGNRRIYLGFSRCKLYEIPRHRRCYICQRPGHLAKDCINSTACSRCSLEHSSRDCPPHSELKCVNCTINGKNDVKHASYSNCCPYNI